MNTSQRLFCLILLGLLTASTNAQSKVRFSEHLIWKKYKYNYGICAADLDGDGDKDLISADAGEKGSLFWFENEGGSFKRRHFITKDEPHRLERHRVADINRDGHLDVVIVENFFGDVKWYQNPGKSLRKKLWKRHYITKGGLLGAYDVDTADFDGDGHVDVVASSWRLGKKFVWYSNPGNESGKWKSRTIDKLPEDSRAVRVGDFNGDGRPDVLGTSAKARLVLWYENTGKKGKKMWKRHVIDLPLFAQPVHGEPYDLDKDGDLDVVMALGGFGTRDNGFVVWYENQGKHDGRIRWKRHTVNKNLPRGFEVVAGDLDGDGDIDLAGTGFDSGIVAWFENPGKGKKVWPRHVLKTGWVHANQILIVDLNGDKRNDIAAVAELGTLEFRWWRNEGKKAKKKKK